ncbi:MAG: hypothetical protein WCO04_12045 [Pseudomonadota bacterium]
MPDGRHHDPHIEGELVGAGLCKKVTLKELTGPFEELDNRTSHAFRPEGEVRRGIEGDGVEVRDMADLVRAFGVKVNLSVALVQTDCFLRCHCGFLAHPG